MIIYSMTNIEHLSVCLRRQLVEKNGNQPSLELVREVFKEPMLRLVPHVEYASLFPFIWKIIPSVSVINMIEFRSFMLITREGNSDDLLKNMLI
ncbi:putative mannosyl-oligosaccharide glucosidase [Helianthus annuus]|nr:putative mannosyl-oligosaccharide glucosidase [Helianthus annuus]